ncbi:hypothetical protein KP509_21G036000 [Ceratopteris richardii]|uniref:digalactosyldiacylglycerol synthase n=1 Tax=Ceratopteris richardii TaxID=49495 RepID=A0A8T2SB09_CERRI|nr:hypothetical protein KP509_21G036000 [Ceratopteris richardii]KAH7315135.1 hypothetical protein KP509_21G036000 [Ceratopteris richardii]KAH7315136.1 hypothetical protein KP509_21G036000 [Ceratopteris richardii]
MAPCGLDSDISSMTAEKAMSFISKSWLDVQRSADEDIKRMRARAKSFTDLANTFDKELDQFRKASLNIASDSGSSGSFLRTFQVNGVLYGASNNSHFGDLESWRKTLSQFQRSQSSSDLLNQKNQLINWHMGAECKPDLSQLTRALSPRMNEEDFYLKNVGGMKKQRASRSKKLAIQEWNGPRNTHRSSKGSKILPDEWEPLKRMKESWRILETTAISSKSPSEFFENLKGTQWFENVKKNLNLSLKSNDETKDVAPLDVPELLAYLVRQSEPLLDQFGLKKDVAEKVCYMLHRYKHKDHTLPLTTSVNQDSLSTTAPESTLDELDLRISSVIQSTGYQYKGGLWGEHQPKNEVDGLRNVAIVTTASLPWMTGTAVNPLFRAAYLSRTGKQSVTLLVPWLCKNDQGLVYPNGLSFDSPEEQEVYIREWLEARVGFKPNFKLVFYPGRFSRGKRSILAAGDISRFIPDKEADIAILEEPEHLNWFHHGKRWTDKFQRVVGIVHTNYLEYIKREQNGALQAFLVEHINNWIARVHCNKILRLSAATQELPKSVVCNVHGVSPRFLDIGYRVATGHSDGTKFSKGAYFLGKMVWGKGYRELIDLLYKHKYDLDSLNVDIYGNGEDSVEVKAEAEKLGLHLKFHQGIDHADSSLHGYKVFINPSISDVVCTTTAEALAMGKMVVCADHPSNEFFRPFPNCLMYKTSEEFVQKVNQAMVSDPLPLSPEQCYMLSWEAATDRFIESAELEKPFKKETKALGPEEIAQKRAMALSMSLPKLDDIIDNGLAVFHFWSSGNEVARLLTGALPGTMNYNLQQSKDLHLPPPAVESPIYTW